jgi:hypothetical protein
VETEALITIEKKRNKEFDVFGDESDADCEELVKFRKISLTNNPELLLKRQLRNKGCTAKLLFLFLEFCKIIF